jgi:hypothetical protein
MSTESEIPLWQKITGFTKDNENALAPEQFNDGVRRLFREVERLAHDDFGRANVPAGERSVYWDPVEHICRVLGLARTKLSRYMRELTGLRAHEVTDRIKASTLPQMVRERLERVLAPTFERLRANFARTRLELPDLQSRTFEVVMRNVRNMRSGENRMRWANELNFPNASRVARACVLAHNTSIDELENREARALVQKFLETLTPAEPPRCEPRAEAETQPERQPEAQPASSIKERSTPREGATHASAESTRELSPETQAILDDAARQTIARSFPKA